MLTFCVPLVAVALENRPVIAPWIDELVTFQEQCRAGRNEKTEKEKHSSPWKLAVVDCHL